MRCPKCGYISFDHLESCSKCKRDLSEANNLIYGTSIKVGAPRFLDSISAERDSSERMEFAFEEDTPPDFDQDFEEESISLNIDDDLVELDLDSEIGEDIAEGLDEAALAIEEDADFQMEIADEPEEPVTAAESHDFELTEEKEEEETPGDQVTLGLESIDLSDLSPEIDPESQEDETLDLQQSEDPLDLWSRSSGEEDEDSMLEKMSEGIFEVLEQAEKHIDQPQNTEPKPSSNSEQTSSPRKEETEPPEEQNDVFDLDLTMDKDE